jgi:hypothetical protein
VVAMYMARRLQLVAADLHTERDDGWRPDDR